MQFRSVLVRLLIILNPAFAQLLRCYVTTASSILNKQFSALIELTSKHTFGGRLLPLKSAFYEHSKIRYKELQITNIKSAEMKFHLILD